MKWLTEITKLIKTAVSKIQINKYVKAALAIFILVILRKATRNKASSSNEVKLILQNISSFYEKLNNNKIASVSILADSIQYQDLGGQQIFKAFIPKHAQNFLQSELRQNKVNFNYLKAAASQNSQNILIFILWSLVGFIIYALVKLDHSEMKTSSKPQNTITFQNIIGLEESKQSLREIINYMKDPQKYRQIGARMRRGIIFYGPSGTGKTTLAKATAGQADVPFFSCNASQFCQIYVGVGPKRVKQLFRKAKQAAPSIIYIDEIDAIGNRKSAGMFNDGANTQKNSTINQLLSQMDGFSSQNNVLVIGSTNRLQMIDSSLLRAGRFDLKIKIPLPNSEDRFKILKYHLTSKKHSISDEYLQNVTKKLENWSGADLQNLSNQSVYASLRQQSGEINQNILFSTIKRLQYQVSQ